MDAADPSVRAAGRRFAPGEEVCFYPALSVRKLCRLAVAAAAAVVIGIPRADAASISVEAPVPVGEGWTRAVGHYDSGGDEPMFQAVARCPANPGEAHVLYSIVHLAPAAGVLWLDLPGSPQRLVPAEVPCETAELSLEMIVATKVVARAVLPQREAMARVPPAALEPPAPQSPMRPSRLRLNGQKYGSPVGRRTEAGVALSLDSHVSIQLNYARTAQVPMMPYANDNGILARLRFGF